MPRISVIIPAYNDAATLAETLASASAQTFRDIEIVVVSDGSTDATLAVAQAAKERDQRIRVLDQANAGVAAARNAGIAASDGEFVAPLDADDLWHPDKLRLQMERFAQTGTRTGLVYNWCRPIDASSRICGRSAAGIVEGPALHRHLLWNFVGNGSTPLIRRAALQGVRYEPELAARGVGGCEDYLIQLEIARLWDFACAPAYLTGYRQGMGRMSGKTLTMLRSRQETFNRMRGKVDGPARELCDRGWTRARVLEASFLAGRGAYGGAAMAMAGAFLNSPIATVAATGKQSRTVVRARFRNKTVPRDALHFLAADPIEQVPHRASSAEMQRATKLDLLCRK